MSFEIISTAGSCGSVSGYDGNPESACSACAPKLALSYEEEAILSRMRAIKLEARPITVRLKLLRDELSSAHGYGHTILGREVDELNFQLEELRESWKAWEQRLNDAIENKLILLGHRPPRVV